MAHVESDEREELNQDIHELKLAVGIEDRESTTKNEREPGDDSGALSLARLDEEPQPSSR
jgi:hypothetical protein